MFSLIDEWDLLNLELLQQQRSAAKLKASELNNMTLNKDKLEIIHIPSCDNPLSEEEYTKSLMDSEEEDMAHVNMGAAPNDISSGEESESIKKYCMQHFFTIFILVL